MMRYARFIRLTLAPALLAAGLSMAAACPLDELRIKLDGADDHVFWFDFWLDFDDREAMAELGYAQSDYAAIETRLQERDCKAHPEAARLLTMVQRSLATCMRWNKAQDGSLADLAMRDRLTRER